MEPIFNDELVNIDSSIIYFLFLFFLFADEPKAETEVVSEDKEIKVAGYLNLAADAFHNFTDGNSSINAFKSKKSPKRAFFAQL